MATTNGDVSFDSIEEAVAAFRNGDFILVGRHHNRSMIT